MNPQNRFSRPSLVAFFGLAGFVVAGLLLWLGSVLTGVLPLALGNIWVHLPMLMGSDLMFLIVWFILWIVIGILVGMRMTRHRAQAVSAALLSERTGFRGKRSFTLIELLIVIAIISVLATVVILALNPAQMLAQARDSSRVSDLHTLNQALALYSEDVGTGMGSSSVVYVSVPDPTATSSAGTDCSGVGLASSSLPSGWTYHCAGPQYYKDINGEGWIPVDFTKMSSGSPMGSLPVDPVNTTSTGLYYTYTVNGDPWELTALMESTKYQMGGSEDVESEDGGEDPTAYEVGTDLALTPAAVVGRGSVQYAQLDTDPSLVGWWKFDEGSGDTAYDSSGHGNNGTWAGTEAGTSGYYSAGHGQSWAGYFDGSTDYGTSSLALPNAGAGFSVVLWANNSSASGYRELISKAPSYYPAPFDIYYAGTAINFFIGNGGSGSSYFQSMVASLSGGVWENLAFIYDGSKMSIYVNGTLAAGPVVVTVPVADAGGPLYFGNRGSLNNGLMDGLIQGVRIYNRALSASEIQAIYDAEK